MNIITIDLEEWYVYELFSKGGKHYFLQHLNNYLEKILFQFEQKKIKATFFCLGIISREYPEVINKIASYGHDIGCHSDIHTIISHQDYRSFRAETYKAIDSLEQLIGKKVTMYRAPAFSISQDSLWALEILLQLGIQIDSSIFPANRSFGGFPGFSEPKPLLINTPSGKIKEFPISYSTILGQRFMFAGGGYFRLFPYWFIKSQMRISDYNMAYFHIRDLDSTQKHVYSWRYFKSYYGIKDAYAKFTRFVNDFDFISLSEADLLIDWEKSGNYKA